MDVLERREYLVGVTIIEGRNIQGKDAQGTSDPFVKVRVADQVQQSQKKYEQNSAVWNQSLTFSGIHMNQYELETFELILELYDHNAIFSNELIGQYSIGLSSLYRNLGHEFYKTWVGVLHPDEPNKPQAYLQISCFIVGPGERPPVHASGEEFGDEEEQDDDEDEESIIKKIEMMKRCQGVTPINSPVLIDKTYQLTAMVIKAENLCSFDGRVNPFVSCRANGFVLTSKHVVNNQSPAFNSKLNIPVTYPILNDKITMRIWSDSSGMNANQFIANIPESPSQFDFFNLSKLLSSDGRMPAKWINLYGIVPHERSSRTRGKKEGSSFLGRILIAFSLIPNEAPQLCLQGGNPIKEPKQTIFNLWIDLYEIMNFTHIKPSDGKQVFVVVSIGSFSAMALSPKYKGSQQSYKFKEHQVPEIKCEFPEDFNQIPDVFISFFCDKEENEIPNPSSRVGYVRLKANWLAVENNQIPKWQKIKTIYNDDTGKDLGQVLVSGSFLRGDSQKERRTKAKSGKQSYKFYYQIFNGFELSAGKIDDKDLNSTFEIKIGTFHEKHKSYQPGRFPQWNEMNSADTKLCKDVSFETDIMVNIYNRKKNLLGENRLLGPLQGGSDDLIGSFTVDISSVMERSLKPQYFNILNEEGQFVGQILASFYLTFYKKNPKNLNEGKELHDQMERDISKINEGSFNNCKVTFSCLGIRNLLDGFKNPLIKLRLTNQWEEEDYKYFEIDAQMDVTNIRQSLNPTYAQIIEFDSIKLSKEPLLWPMIELTITEGDQGLNLGLKKEDLCTTISLIPYAQEILEQRDINYAIRQLERNQDQLGFNQQQIPYTLVDEAEEESDDSDEDKKSVEKLGRGTRNTMARGVATNIRKTVVNQGVTNFVKKTSKGKLQVNRNTDLGEIDLFNDIKDLKDYNDPDEKMEAAAIQALQDEMQGGGIGANFGVDQQADAAQEDQKLQNIQNDDLETGILLPFKFEIKNNDKEKKDHGKADTWINLVPDKIMVFSADKQAEQEMREQKIGSLNEQIKGYQRKLKEDPEDIEKSRILNMKIMEIKEELEDLKNEKMSKEKFWGVAADDEDEDFDWGRDTLKEGNFEKFILSQIPYMEFSLFTKPKWSLWNKQQEYVIGEDNILRSGIINQATLKANLNIVNDEEESEDEASMEDENEEESKEAKAKKLEPALEVAAPSGNKHEYINKQLQKFNEEMPFSIFKPNYIQKLKEDHQKEFKIRVYIISCQNLSAMGNKVDFKSQLAGMSAMCTATPYPQLILGDGDEGTKKIKRLCDREIAIEGELNPRFLKIYEFDANFPEDALMAIQIMNKGDLQQVFDQMIGQTLIDLETRRHADLLLQNRLANDILLEDNKKEVQELKQAKSGKSDLTPQQIKAKDEELRKTKQYLEACKKELKRIPQVVVPIEFRELYHPEKSQAQGVVEMFTEILSAEDSRKFPISKMQTVLKETYEIRVIIWETKDVPLTDGGSVDIFVKCTLDPTGWSEDEITKETDTHMASKDGNGQFNWRMKFDLTVPCEFPRLKFSIFDAGLAADEAIGETTLSLKRTLKKLKSEDRVSVPKSYLSISNPTNPIEEKGILMFSMDILLKADANQDPVGEAQEEPNKDPFLKKPTAGRGLGDAFAALGIEMPDISFNPFGKYIYVIAFFGLMGTILTFAVLLK